MANKNKNKYEIESITYLKVPTNVKYPDDYVIKHLRGKKVYKTKEKIGPNSIKSTWSILKQDAYKQSVADKNVSVTWKTPRKQLVKITKSLPNGVKEVTYFKPKYQRGK